MSSGKRTAKMGRLFFTEPLIESFPLKLEILIHSEPLFVYQIVLFE
jgi:hypothetical protein